MTDLELNLMDMSLNELLRNVSYNEYLFKEQYNEIKKFRDIILTASNRRFDKVDENKTTIFLAGSGRSGFVAKFFAMRLVHLGYIVYVFGESLVPQVRDGDIIIFISKSGGKNAITDSIEVTQVNKKDKNTETDAENKEEKNVNADKKAEEDGKTKEDRKAEEDGKTKEVEKEETDEDDFKLNKEILENITILSVCGSFDCFLAKNSDAKIVINPLKDRELTKEEEERLDSLNFNPPELVLMGTGFEDSALIMLDALVVELMNNLGLTEKDLEDQHENIKRAIKEEDKT